VLAAQRHRDPADEERRHHERSVGDKQPKSDARERTDRRVDDGGGR
jgi:hypothetical protein